jgi:uroporphyrinogen-III synthase
MGDGPARHGALTGVGVLVTRPAGQSAPLARALDGLGARVIEVPLLAIEPPRDPEAARAKLDRIETFDLAVFVSANAVGGAMALLAPGRTIPAGLPLAAVGRATAAALRAHGLEPTLVPGARQDSEGLLALPALQDPGIAGRRVLIVRGEGGRELLADTLRARGAAVEYAQVYRRTRAPVDPAALDALAAAGAIDVVLVSSGAALEGLIEALAPRAHPWLERVTLVVPSERVAQQARGHGPAWAVLVAPGPDDASVLRALVDWRAAGGTTPGPRASAVR